MIFYKPEKKDEARKDLLARFNTPYKRFLYLDREQILNSLACLQGGDIDSILESSLTEGGWHAGGGLSLGGKVEGGLKRGKEARRELKLRQNVHSAITQLVTALESAEAIAHFDEPSDVSDLKENLVVQFEARLTPLRVNNPNPRVESGFWDKLLGRVDPSEILARQQAVMFGDRSIGQAEVRSPELEAVTSTEIERESKLILLELESRWLLIRDVAEFSRYAVIVGQVSGVSREEGEHIIVKGGRAWVGEREDEGDDSVEPHEWTTPKSPSSVPEYGLSGGPEVSGFGDASRTKPGPGVPHVEPSDSQAAQVLVRPICIYK
jgi:hypothetical protein